ncbi:MAG TPA: enoyl-CoA hydratase-related protein [Marmoricola sp.]|nr:enoyl-CoA hydratase-related protein [Marmoricola sp.]
MIPEVSEFAELVPGLKIHRGNGVVAVYFDRPERRNAFTAVMYQAMHNLWDELATDTSVRAIVLRGVGGKAFAAGNEISDFLKQDPVPYEESIRAMFSALWSLPQVTIAAIDGVCVGGGLAVATHCDLRIATPHSRFGYPIARTLGNALTSPVVYRCAAVFGESVTREMLLSSRLVDAQRAYNIGALMSVTEDLDAEVNTVLEGILQASGVTLRTTKQQMLSYAERLEVAPEGEEEAMYAVYGGPDFKEGVRAFLAKEKPNFAR